MTIVRAYLWFTILVDRLIADRHPLAANIEQAWIPEFTFNARPITLVTAASLSGQLGFCHDSDQLIDAAAHYFQHLHGHLYHTGEFQHEALRIVDDLVSLGIIRINRVDSNK